MITDLQSASCSNRNKINSEINLNELKDKLPPDFNVLSFHFFAQWSQEYNKSMNNYVPISDEVWMTKRLLKADADITDVASWVENNVNFQNQYFTFKKFSKKYGFHTSLIFLPEYSTSLSYDQIKDRPVYVGKYINQKLQVFSYTIEYLGGKIQTLSNGKVNVGSKGLIYGTSCMECILSKTDKAYPGDVDAVILKDQTPIAIIEFKKHNSNKAGPDISEHTASKYSDLDPSTKKYGPDRKKYIRIMSLCRKFNLPLIMFYYDNEQHNVLLETISDVLPNIVVLHRSQIIHSEDPLNVLARYILNPQEF
nr:hypothetical protein [uncultured Acinetobacter sp.]